jgi:alpha-glucosidase (family GH31 glycosyl hydrolase)
MSVCAAAVTCLLFADSSTGCFDQCHSERTYVCCSVTDACVLAPAVLVLCAPAAHANGARQYDTHNLFGTGMAMNHHASFKQVVGKRPFRLSR